MCVSAITTNNESTDSYLLLELGLVEGEVVVEDRKLVVSPSILVEEQLREEGEVLRVPDVARIAGTERDTVV